MNELYNSRDLPQTKLKSNFFPVRINRLAFSLSIYAFLPVLLFAVLPSRLTAQTMITRMSFSPPSFYVGDTVELDITLAIDNKLKLEVPSVYPHVEWIEIHIITVEQSTNEANIHISFTPFVTGTRILPSLDFGVIQLKDIKITILSLLETSRPEARQLRGQLLIPGTKLAITAFLTLISLSPFFLLMVIKLIIRGFRRAKAAFRFHQPVRHLRRLVKRLRTDLGTQSPGIWFTHLTEGLRIYLGERLHHDCRSATTAEIAAMKEFSGPDTPQNKLLMILKEADMVKFAGRKVDELALRQALYIVETESNKLEKLDDYF